MIFYSYVKLPEGIAHQPPTETIDSVPGFEPERPERPDSICTTSPEEISLERFTMGFTPKKMTVFYQDNWGILWSFQH